MVQPLKRGCTAVTGKREALRKTNGQFVFFGNTLTYRRAAARLGELHEIHPYTGNPALRRVNQTTRSLPNPAEGDKLNYNTGVYICQAKF